MDSGNDSNLKFLEAYQCEPVIWDPRHIHHKDKKQVNDAWFRLSVALDCAVEELKRKRDSLMATFRGHLRKKKAAIRSGAGVDDVYKPVWFAFETMEAFLGPVYDCTPTINSQEMSLVVEPKDDSVNSSEIVHASKRKRDKSISAVRNTKETSPYERENETCQLPTTTVEQLTCSDEWGDFSRYIAHKLRKLNPRNQLLAERHIVDFLIDLQMQEMTGTGTLDHTTPSTPPPLESSNHEIWFK